MECAWNLHFAKTNCILKIEVFPWWVVLVLEEYMLRIWIFFFFQYVLVLFDGCMIVHLLLSHVFGSVTGLGPNLFTKFCNLTTLNLVNLRLGLSDVQTICTCCLSLITLLMEDFQLISSFENFNNLLLLWGGGNWTVSYESP